MKSMFTNEEMLAEAEQLVKDDALDAEDRATIMGFYNGQESMSAAQAEEAGDTSIVNHLLGFDSLNTAKTQVESIFTKGKTIFEITLRDMPKDKKHLRSKWETTITERLNSIIKDSRRLRPEWKSVAGEITLFGNGTLMFRDQYDWCPTMARPYVPRGTGILARDIPYSVVADYMTIQDLRDALKCAQGRKSAGFTSPWNEGAIKTTIACMEGTLKAKNSATAITGFQMESVDELAEQASANAIGSAGSRMRIPVFYFFWSKGSEGPVDMAILPRLTISQKEDVAKSVMPYPTYLFKQEAFYEKPEHFIHPFFVDCKMGGKTSWHRVLGLGRMNYDPDVETESFFNEAMEGARENIRRLYQTESTADWDMLKMWDAGGGPKNVLPPGVKVADVSRQPNFQHAMQPMGMLMQLTKRNAASQSPTAEGKATQELEVNALERQSRNAEVLGNRMNDLYEAVDALGIEIFRRFISDDALPTDRGYKEISEFQADMRRAGIPLAFLRKLSESGRFAHVTVRCSRAAGDGNTVKRRMANAALMQRLSLFPSASQAIILRRITAEEMDDYDFAETVVPYEPMRDVDQETQATTENEQCNELGIINVIPQLTPEDIDTTHLEIHLRSMEADVARGKVRPWDQVDLASFMCKGSHSAMHIQKMKSSEETRQAATQYEQKLQKLAKAGQEFQANMQKAQEAQKQPMSEKDQATIQLKQRDQQLKEHAQKALEDHRAAALKLSAEKVAITNDVAASQMAIAEDAHVNNKMGQAIDQTMDMQRMAMEQEQMAQQAAQSQEPAPAQQ